MNGTPLTGCRSCGRWLGDVLGHRCPNDPLAIVRHDPDDPPNVTRADFHARRFARDEDHRHDHGPDPAS